jgi:hypothetical protein
MAQHQSPILRDIHWEGAGPLKQTFKTKEPERPINSAISEAYRLHANIPLERLALGSSPGAAPIQVDILASGTYGFLGKGFLSGEKFSFLNSTHRQLAFASCRPSAQQRASFR